IKESYRRAKTSLLIANRESCDSKYVRPLLDSFDISGPEDKPRCLVHPPLWERVLDFLFRNPVQRLTAYTNLGSDTSSIQNARSPILVQLSLPGFMLNHLLINILNVKADNVMFGIADDSTFGDFENNELQNACPRKELSGRTVYTSRELRMPKNLGAPILCDFGLAVMCGEEHSEDIQPDIYRARVVIL
ncbi:kinase-like protein, partial [Penicillium waksmanii]|uniref:kinase-like protein n=1 Tax=Penicillium waksmanii TaxID=69791 RepID=UPI0025474D1B